MKPRKCKSCGACFEKQRALQSVCSPLCAADLARAKKEQAEQRKRSEERNSDRKKREELKTRSDWIKDAQQAFNRYVRLRDAGKPCICCGLPLEAGAVGGGYDCGHYRSVGSAPHLRFDERNAAGQRKQCNRYGSGRAVDYRLGLIARIGLVAVEELEADQSSRHWSIEELRKIRDTYRQKEKELEKQCCAA